MERLLLENDNLALLLLALALAHELGDERHDHSRKMTTSKHEEGPLPRLARRRLALDLRQHLDRAKLGQDLWPILALLARTTFGEEGAVYAVLGVGSDAGRVEPDDSGSRSCEGGGAELVDGFDGVVVGSRPELLLLKDARDGVGGGGGGCVVVGGGRL